MVYDLHHAIREQQIKNNTNPSPPLSTPPSVNPAPNQPNAKDGGISDDEFEAHINKTTSKVNDYSTSGAVNNPNNKNNANYGFKHNGLNNPNDNKDDINPDIPNNHTPFQRIMEIAQLIERYSLPTLWERAFPCPCISSSGYPKTDCPICHGLGLAFEKPVEIGIAFQRDNLQYYNGREGIANMNSGLATPQITENGLESGLSPRDRLSVPGMTDTQTYIFNVSNKRINQGEIIPYRVQSIDQASTQSKKDGHLIKLVEGKDFTFNYTDFVFRPKKKWLNYNISLRMTVAKRFYVTNTLKETRYATTTNPETKNLLFGKNKPNKDLTDYVRNWKRLKSNGEVYIRMPKLLVVRAENTVVGNMDFDKTKGTEKNNVRYHESKVTSDPTNPLNMILGNN